MKIMIIVENAAYKPLDAEHGLSMFVEHNSNQLIFDFGKTSLWLKNAEKLQLDLAKIKYAFISHGHNDHTGGLEFFMGEIFCTSDIAKKRFSHHENKPVRELSMPPAARQVFENSKVRFSDDFQEIMPGIFSTGKIPRISGEDTGGPFFLDLEKKHPDTIDDESALLFDNGVLLHGCCHSGIINTLEHCTKNRPDIKIHTIVGGLHLLHADEKRLQQTADHLKNYGIRKLYLMHCTGENGIEYLKKNLPDTEIFTPHTGDVIFFD